MSLEVFFFVLLGLALGSFGNVLLMRLKKGLSICGRSHCMHCRKNLNVIDLLPILSYVFLGGRCRHCARVISLQYPIIELLSAILFGVSAVLYPEDLPLAILTGLLLYVLLLSSAFDVLYQELPDACTIVIAALGLLIAFLTDSLYSSLLGLGLALLWFGGQWVLSKGKAVGMGDVFLAAALAVWLGLGGTISMLLFSYMVGAVTVLLFLSLGIIKWNHQRIAFAPFLAIGALLTLLGVGQGYSLFLYL